MSDLYDKESTILKDACYFKDVNAAQTIRIRSHAQKIGLEIPIVYTKTLCLGAFSLCLYCLLMLSSFSFFNIRYTPCHGYRVDVVAPSEVQRLTIHAGHLRKPQHRPTYAEPDASTSTPSLIKRRTLDEIDPHIAGNKKKNYTHKRTGFGRTGRPKKTATGAWAINTTREHVVSTLGETVVLGCLPNRLFQGSEYYSHLAGYTWYSLIQPDTTLVNPGIQVVVVRVETWI